MSLINKQFTIADIAKGAGVSKTTVSRYLNGKFEFMSEETKKRIEMIIQVANYQPNNVARTLKSNRSMQVGVVIADIESPFSSSVIKGVGDVLSDADYSMIIINSDNSLEKEQQAISSLLSQRVDGLVVNTVSATNPFLINLVNQGMPIVLADRFVKNYNFDIVYVETHDAICNVIDHLKESGYGRLYLFTQFYANVSSRYLRREAFIEKMEMLGEIYAEQYVFEVDISEPSTVDWGIQQMLEVCQYDGAPPAIITTNGIVLLHIVNAIKKMGLQLPSDLGLCGFDDWGWAPSMGWASMIAPGITALSAHAHIVGTMSANILLERMNGGESPKKIISVPAELIVRGSTTLHPKD
ncbi:LacI family DNA-binding transcriptional regulator [Oscillospiraceae bacterium PP1C4]